MFYATLQLREHMMGTAHRTTGDSKTFWASKQFKDLDNNCAGALTAAVLEWHQCYCLRQLR